MDNSDVHLEVSSSAFYDNKTRPVEKCVGRDEESKWLFLHIEIESSQGMEITQRKRSKQQSRSSNEHCVVLPVFYAYEQPNDTAVYSSAP